MKAEEFLRQRKVVSGEHKDLIIGFSDGTKESLIDLLNEYAKEQIEKDRDRVKKAYINSDWKISFGEILRDTPIILD